MVLGVTTALLPSIAWQGLQRAYFPSDIQLIQVRLFHPSPLLALSSPLASRGALYLPQTLSSILCLLFLAFMLKVRTIQYKAIKPFLKSAILGLQLCFTDLEPSSRGKWVLHISNSWRTGSSRSPAYPVYQACQRTSEFLPGRSHCCRLVLERIAWCISEKAVA